MRRLLFIALAAFVTLTSSGRSSVAQPRRRTAVLPITFDGKISDVGRTQMSFRLSEALATQGFEVFASEGPVQELLKARPEFGRCGTPSCYRELAASLLADYLVMGRVTSNQKNYGIAVQLVSGVTGEVVAANETRCELCGIQEALQTVGDSAAALKGGLTRTEMPAQVTVESDPAGALIVVDGKPVGFAPMTVEVPLGIREIALRAEGHETQKRTIEVKPGSQQELRFDLTREPGPRFSRVPWRGIGWVSVAFGAALAVGGVYAMSLRTCDNVSEVQECSELSQRSMTLGGALLGGAGFALGFGALSFYAGSVSQSSSAAGAQQQASLPGFMLVSTGRF